MPPADVLTAYSSSRPRCRVSLAAFFKPFRRRGSSSAGVAMGSSSAVTVGVGSKAAVDGVCWWLPGPSV
jgi:hypothetical protein